MPMKMSAARVPLNEPPSLPVCAPGLLVNDIAPLLVGNAIHAVERELILQTLAYESGNRTEAACVLEISIRTLRNRLRDYTAAGIDVPEPGHVGFPLLRH